MKTDINVSDVKQVYIEPDTFVSYSGEHLTTVTIVGKGGEIHINCYSKKEIKRAKSLFT